MAGLPEAAAGEHEDMAGMPEDNGDYEAIEAALSEMTTSGDISFTEIKDKLLAGDFRRFFKDSWQLTRR